MDPLFNPGRTDDGDDIPVKQGRTTRRKPAAEPRRDGDKTIVQIREYTSARGRRTLSTFNDHATWVLVSHSDRPPTVCAFPTSKVNAVCGSVRRTLTTDPGQIGPACATCLAAETAAEP